MDGVSEALVLPRRRGGGTVDVVITGPDGVPSAEVIAAVLAHIKSVCSVLADVWVYPPQVKVVDCRATVELESGYTLAAVQLAAENAYIEFLNPLKPGDTPKRSQLEAMISNLAGVLDREVITPAGNIPAADDPLTIGWIRPGTITLELVT